jgi:hypothetical protein
MQPLAKPTDRLLLRLSQSLVKDALESKLGVAFVDVDLGRDLEQAVRGPDVAFQGGVAAANEDGLEPADAGFGKNFEVVGYLGTGLVGGGEELGWRPELVRCCGRVAVFCGEVEALGGIACVAIEERGVNGIGLRVEGGGEMSHVIDVVAFGGTKWEKSITESAPDASTECLNHFRATLFSVFHKLLF